MNVILKVYAIVLLSVIATNAGTGKSTQKEQYIALTGGTNGFGAKYSYCIGPLSMDFGLPLIYRTEEIKHKDTVERKNELKINPYLSANLIVFRKERATVSVGVAWVATMGSIRDRRKVDTVVVVKNETEDFIFNSYFGPIFEYNQRGKNNNKLFGAQLFPVKFIPGARKTFSIDIGIQLNFFLKKMGCSPEEND